MTDPFDGPGSISSLKWEEYENRLVLITPLLAVDKFTTTLGEGPVIRADVVVLDGPGSPIEIRDTIIFPKVLQGQIRGNVGTGRSNLGRVGKGEKRPGQSAPWVLGEPSAADKDIARAYLKANPPRPPATGGGAAGGGATVADAPPF
ncbi:MAG TPA: hypothetical protein VFX53_09375 [Pedococcus sp.]|nr:hypothetical protein [Pedococcus sp.]